METQNKNQNLTKEEKRKLINKNIMRDEKIHKIVIPNLLHLMIIHNKLHKNKQQYRLTLLPLIFMKYFYLK